MPYYETVFIARQDLSNSQVEGLADKAEEIITSRGGKISRRENWGLRTLAYRIKKNRKGYYILLNYEGNHEATLEIERTFNLSEDIIRYMTTMTEEACNEASVMVRRYDEPEHSREAPAAVVDNTPVEILVTEATDEALIKE